ncbi:MAG: MarR family transcriptional regulator [Candidatus Bathyarchaeota archaeon]|nr:MarR family transcriptional regulator [Candidatus Bathyarchaeum tardum]WGM90489.1 MAG: MarR family transcriptional regulator [Candidatus Bathyarchaeum tardum]WNZ29443.1 MAG: MarR family transcriptional regulator [Candidatus Bathyarchaeota archaeon]
MAHEAIEKAKSLLTNKENVEKVKSLLARKTSTVEEPKQPMIQEDFGRTKKSKLVMCIEILCNLVSKGPMKLSQLQDQMEIDQARLTAHLRLLWDRGLIEEEQFDDDQIYYLVTQRGKTVLKVVSPILKEAHKIQMQEYHYLTNTLEGAGYT